MGIVLTGYWGIFRQKVMDALHNVIGRGLEFIRAPAKLKQFEFVDLDANETIYVYRDRLYQSCV